MSSPNISYNNSCNNDLALCKSSVSTKDKFWLDEPTVLYKNNNYLHFMPVYEMTRNQQLNALSRLAFYTMALLFIFTRSKYSIIIPVTFIILLVLIDKFKIFDPDSNQKELNRILEIRQAKADHQDELVNKEYHQDGTQILKSYDEIVKDEFGHPSYSVGVGKYDPDGKLLIGQEWGPKGNPEQRNLYTVDEQLDYQKNTCRRPTPDNPMMNPSVEDFETFNPPAACNAEDSNIQESIKVNFNQNLFRDVDDVWERANSQRQFYTIPNTAIPNNQTEFAHWLYKLPDYDVCKEGSGVGCARYDPLPTRTPESHF